MTVQNLEIKAFLWGIVLNSCLNNSVYGNNIANNDNGVWIDQSSNNKFYHNNFMDNTKHVYDASWSWPYPSPSINTWDDGYPSGGNYWSDYVGVDIKSGPNQDLPGSDGIGDMPYAIDANNRDRYPLMYPYGSPPLPTYSLTITTTANGTTDPATGTYLYSQGQSVLVQAIPDTGYGLDHWRLDGSNVGSANPYSVLMDNNHTLHSVFVPTYTLTITTTAGGITSPPPDPHIYNVGTSVPVGAIPDTYYCFDHWELDGVNRTSLNHGHPFTDDIRSESGFASVSGITTQSSDASQKDV